MIRALRIGLVTLAAVCSSVAHAQFEDDEPTLRVTANQWVCHRSSHGTGDGVCKGLISAELINAPVRASNIRATCKVEVLTSRLRNGTSDPERLVETLQIRMPKETSRYAAGEQSLELDFTSAAAPATKTHIQSTRCTAAWELL